jgi:DNA topoisomerase-1
MIYIMSNNLEDTLNKFLNINISQTGGERESYDIKNYNSGIARKLITSSSNKFEYFYIKDKTQVTKKDQARIDKLGIPPAWADVWVSSNPNSDIQAIGVDSKGRKQYRYHESHIKEAEKEKFLRLIDFIKAIPNLEKIMKQHNKLSHYHKNRVIVTVLTLVKELHMRVGKEQYARENKSYGVSSLEKKHMHIDGDLITFKFKGKSSKRLTYSIRDADLKAHLQLLLKLHGDKLFQYIDDNNQIRKITDTDLNSYIQQYMGSEFTIKDFRTYGANFYFIKSLLNETSKRLPSTDKIIKKNIVNAIRITAYHLKHTKAISKKSYVMSFAIEMYQNNPNFFIERKADDPNSVLIDILKLYKKEVLHV